MIAAPRRATALACAFGTLLTFGPASAGAQPAGATAPTSTAQEAPQKPRIRLFATGGTISNRTGGRLSADELVASATGVDRVAIVETEQFANVASSQLTLDQYLSLARRIGETFAADHALAGVVVTCGTDTLEELAYFLHLTVRDDRPVVVVGAMRNPSTLGHDGAANLLQGIRVAAEPAARGLGTLVVLNDEINSAREVTKTDALRLHTFQSPPVGVLGVVDADRVVFYRRPVKRSGARSEFDVRAIERLPRVDIFVTYQDAPGDFIRAAVDAGARGLVIAAAGAGATSGTQPAALDYAASKQVLIVTATRTGSGRIAPRRGSGPVPSALAQRAALSVAAEDLAPIKARILLMLALSRGSNRDDIQRMFEEY